MCRAVWCQVDISTTELAGCSPPRPPTHILPPLTVQPQPLSQLPPQKSVRDSHHQTLSQMSQDKLQKLSRCNPLMSCEAHPLPGWFEHQRRVNSTFKLSESHGSYPKMPYAMGAEHDGHLIRLQLTAWASVNPCPAISQWCGCCYTLSKPAQAENIHVGASASLHSTQLLSKVQSTTPLNWQWLYHAESLNVRWYLLFWRNNPNSISLETRVN